MNRLKIIIIFGTRPEVIKMAPVIEEIKRNPQFSPILVSTGQHREMLNDVSKIFNIKTDYDLNIMTFNQALNNIVIKATEGLSRIFKLEKPDIVLVQGDTTTAFISSLTAFYNKITVAHVEAGLRSFNKYEPFPEEVNRKLISTIADLHFAPTKQSWENLLMEGVSEKDIYITGNTVIDALHYVSRMDNDRLEEYLPSNVFNSKRMLLVTFHRRENWGTALENFCLALNYLTERYDDIKIVFPVHRNPNVRKKVFEVLSKNNQIHLLDPLPYEPFVEALKKSFFIITDSGGIQEEAPSLGQPVLVLRNTTERPEGIASGNVKLIGTSKHSIIKKIQELLDNPLAYMQMAKAVNPYGDGKASKRIVQAILHYYGLADKPVDFKTNEISELQQMNN